MTDLGPFFRRRHRIKELGVLGVAQGAPPEIALPTRIMHPRELVSPVLLIFLYF